MKTRFTILILVALTAWPVLAANEEMRKLDWLIGEWKGEATVQMGPGEPQRIIQTERVQSKLGGKVLLIEGQGRRADGEIVHDAMAVLTWDDAKKVYRFSTWLFNRPGAETTLEVTGPNAAVWGLDTPQGRMRYTMKLTDEGVWHEVGEFSRDGGANWMKFIDMRLSKVK
ncbi:MAG TPA: DUF1579 family protein [Thermoanaerobaculia bacterium]|nr:DUF1579 family protein [Thermoanaerobaculia bacterium]